MQDADLDRFLARTECRIHAPRQRRHAREGAHALYELPSIRHPSPRDVVKKYGMGQGARLYP
jgi:hypothetical protein